MERLEIQDDIIEAVKHIRGSDNRASFDNIKNVVKRREERCDMASLKNVIDVMENDGLVINKGKRNLESFYLCEENFENKVVKENLNGDPEITNLTEYMREKFYDTVKDEVTTQIKVRKFIRC